MNHGITHATREWLAELVGSGWTVEVVESPARSAGYRLLLADDLEAVVRERVTPAGASVVCRRGDSCVAVACVDGDAARELLESVLAEAEAA